MGLTEVAADGYSVQNPARHSVLFTLVFTENSKRSCISKKEFLSDMYPDQMGAKEGGNQPCFVLVRINRLREVTADGPI